MNLELVNLTQGKMASFSVPQGSDQIFSVVEFFRTHEVDLVATKWLFTDVERKTKVYWPPYPSHKCRAQCLQQVDADPRKWKVYDVRVFYQTADLAKAMMKLARSEETSDMDTTAPEISADEGMAGDKENNGRFKLKRNARVPQRFVDSGPSGDEDNESSIPKPAAKKVSASPPPKVPRSLSSRNRSDSQLDMSERVSRRSPSPALVLRSPSPGRNASTPNKKQVDKLVSSVADLANEVRRIRISMVEMKEEVRQNRKLLKKIVSSLDRTAAAAQDEPEPLPQPLPLSTIDEFNQMEGRLEDTALVKNLALHLSKFGAPDTKKAVKSILGTVMTVQLMTKFNWKAQRGEKIAMSTKKLVSVICAAVRLNSSTKGATNEEVKEIIKEDLRYAEKRWKRTRPAVAAAAEAPVPENNNEEENNEDNDVQ